ncbi:MAG: peptidoglycan editing factor PgeF [Chloroflexi bacterium]|uniref:Purine nucleoside phosphorylase n=2 Tax=Candidatus Thermofonsia Clade 3 TaxID=2364209 RepID=A0A2M8QDB2_9CHLR|nr:MAG: peptidoglycan editing factor PgeF [Candidatus Thermofonsia Clade 3 bacterium]RMG64595.1 MAG: peptidoglycan editing factor PgeF [Chloroflexota bacterium]
MAGGMQRLTHHALAYYQFAALRAANVNHGVFTRLGGVSEAPWASLNMSCSTGDAAEPVRENRRRALDALGLAPERSLTSWLVHGNHVRVVSRDDLRIVGANDVRADAMVTRDRGLALTLRFADCAPVLFYDPLKGAIGIAHAGWRGIVNGVLIETVRAMQRAFGSRPQDIIAGIGPCIGPDKFEVDEAVAAQIQAAVRASVVLRGGDGKTSGQGKEHASPSFPGQPITSKQKPHVDLWAAARSQLEDAGVGCIEVAAICTANNTHEWFSHRAEQGRTGRFGVIVALD